MTAASCISRLTERLLNALFPLECLACGREGSHVCAACLAGIALIPKEPKAPPVLTAVVCAYAYAQPVVRTLIGDYKYRALHAARPAIETLARRSAGACAGRCGSAEIIVPVPLHERRLRERGFNQAETIAVQLAASLKKPVSTKVLVRARETRPQAEPETDRARNVLGAFLADRDLVTGRRILLVDDVWTTGATMGACAEALLSAGAREVRGYALAWGKGNDDKKN